MATKTLSQKIIDIVGDNPDGIDETKELQIKDLLNPIGHETDIKKAEWRERKGSW